MKQRLEWLDVMKGFAMFLVVLGHVLNNMRLFTHPVNLWLHQFHMPFFFMLSGFLAVKTLNKDLLGNIWTKFITLILPFIVCGVTYGLTFGKTNEFIYTEAHAGYWFLLSLFTCWLIFLPLAYMLRPFRYGRYFIIEALVLLMPFFLGNHLMKHIPGNVLSVSSFSFTFADYRFFILGYFIGKWYGNKDIVKHFYRVRQWIFPISMIVFLSITIGILMQRDFIYFIPITVLQIILSLSLFAVLHDSAFFVSPFIIRRLSWIGRNSLALYVFHFYFVYLPPPPENLAENASVFQIMLAIILTIVVIAITMAVSSPFRNNKILAFCFLGQKK